MTGSYAALVLEEPDADHGVATGHGDWRLVVEAAIPNQGFWQWDVSEWDEDDWSDGWEWHDLSDRVRGVAWTRGRDGLEGRPETGDASIDFANHDGYLSAWNGSTTFPAPFSLLPGTLVRIGWWDPDADVWAPAFTGLLERATDHSAENTDADLWITWDLVETTSLLAAIDELSAGSFGEAETGNDRFARLLAWSRWPFGMDLGGYYSPFHTAPLQATTLSQNRLGEVYLTADSLFVDAYSGRDGRLKTWAKGYYEPWYFPDGATKVGLAPSSSSAGTTRWLPWAEPPEIAVDTDQVMNAVTVGRAGGGTRSGVHQQSVGLYGRASYRRTDLILTTDSLLVDWVSAALSLFAGNVIRPSSVGVDGFMDSHVVDAVATLDLHLSVLMVWPKSRHAGWGQSTFLCQVVGYRVRCQAVTAGLLDVRADLNLVVRGVS